MHLRFAVWEREIERLGYDWEIDIWGYGERAIDVNAAIKSDALTHTFYDN